MKTILQIANELGVSRQAVYSKMKKPPLANALQTCISKVDNVLTVSLDGEKLIKQAFSKSIAVNKLSTKNNPLDSELIKLLCKTVDNLTEQLAVKDKQIAELNAIIKIQAEKPNRTGEKSPSPKPYKINNFKKSSAPLERLLKNVKS